MIVRRLSPYLCHHGIKNQHWGVRNGPPYPLDKKTSNAIKRGKNEDRHEGKKVGTSHSAAAAGGTYTRQTEDIEKMSWDDFFEQPEEYRRQFRDTDLGLKEVNKFYDSEGNWEYKNPLELSDVQELLNSNLKSGKNKTLCLSDEFVKQINNKGFADTPYAQNCLYRINPEYHQTFNEEAHNNCSKCSDMVELVQRGLNPNTFNAGRSKFGMLSSANEYHWDGAVTYKEKSYANIEKRCLSFGNKGSGTISIRRSDGSGHSMHFTVVKGRVEVQDGQSGKIYRNIKDALEYQMHDPNQFCHITRLDNARPNVKHMLEDNVIRMDTTDQFGTDNWSSGVEYKPGKVWINKNDSLSTRTYKNSDEINESKMDDYRSKSTGKSFRNGRYIYGSKKRSARNSG